MKYSKHMKYIYEKQIFLHPLPLGFLFPVLSRDNYACLFLTYSSRQIYIIYAMSIYTSSTLHKEIYYIVFYISFSSFIYIAQKMFQSVQIELLCQFGERQIWVALTSILEATSVSV